MMEAPISCEEAKEVVWACGSEMMPVPEGFTFKLIKQLWSLISPDAMHLIHHFEDPGTLSLGCNFLFITLAPKTKDPASLNDFRPISLIVYLYKIISKILGNCIKIVIGGIIGDVQSTYVEG